MLNSHVIAGENKYLPPGAGCFFVGCFLLMLTWFYGGSVYVYGELRCGGW